MPREIVAWKKNRGPAKFDTKTYLCPPVSLMVNVNHYWFVGETEDGSMLTVRKRNKTVTVRIMDPLDTVSFCDG